jgi:hypothetical protein
LQTPTTLRIDDRFSTTWIMKLATSAREIGRHGMTVFNGLPNEFQSGASCGTQDNQFHAARCGAPSALRLIFDATLHIGCR